MNKTHLYKKDKREKMWCWSIWQEGDSFIIEFGVMNGEIQRTEERVPFGLGGRTAQEQMESQIRSRINKKLDGGYCRTIGEANIYTNKNLLGHSKPMLATAYSEKKFDSSGMIHIQHKLDGHRCLIVNDCGRLIAYSRNGKRIETIDYILDQIEMPEGMILDGELYAHGMPLQKISHMVRNIKRKDEIDKSKLKFICYDEISDENYTSRYAKIGSVKLGDSAQRIHSDAVILGDGYHRVLNNLLQRSLENGFEGLILRKDKSPYESGRRSKNLIKLKPIAANDHEFLVIDIEKSKEGFGILVCEINDRVFRMTAPGTHVNKKHIADNKQKYIGEMIRAKFASYSEDGIPTQPVAIDWRNPLKE